MAFAGGGQAASSQPLKRCLKPLMFADVAGCAGSHPPWLCRAFGDKVPEERGKIIRDNRLCLFCLLPDVDEVCYSKVNKTKLICEEAGCKEQHIKWLHEMLKEIPSDSGKAEGRVKWSRGEKTGGLPRTRG